MADLHGAAGAEWLGRLPALIDELADRWALTVLPPFEPLSYNYVAPAVCAGGRPVVLKIGVVHPELLTEIEALRLFDGRGAVRLLEADAGQGALLLEHLVPGTPLAALADDASATCLAAGVMRQLWRPVPADHPFPTVERWALGLQRLRAHFGGGCGPFPLSLVKRAESLFAELIASMGEPVLLHGDLHHHNILAASRQPWLALDPKGLVGEPEYETGALLRNPMPEFLTWPDLPRVTWRRAGVLAGELGFDRARLIAWATAQAVLAGWWSYEDTGSGWQDWVACAQI
ncbi:MAG: aminoglycoside phosphotransferase family protein, partial [Anaerolineae bacterium]